MHFDTAKNTRDEDGINCLIVMPLFGEASMHPPDMCKMVFFALIIPHPYSSLLIPAYTLLGHQSVEAPKPLVAC